MTSPFEVSIHLSADNDVSRVLKMIATDVIGLNTNVEGFKKNLKDIASGAIKLSVAFGMAEFLKDLADANGLLERQLNIFRMTGNSQADTLALRRAAYDSAVQVRGVGVVEQAKLARELSSALQDNRGARAVLPDFARAKAVIAFATGRDNDDDTTRLAKMIELRGGATNPKTDKIDPEMFRKELDAATKAIVVGQGLLTTNDLQQMIKQGGPAMKNFRGNPGAFWADTLALAEDMGGARAGTATTAIARQVLGGIMTPKVAAEWERLGMFNPEGQGWAHNKKGQVEIDDPAKAIRGYSAFQHGGVEEFVDKFIKPAFEKAGITSPDGINAEMYKFGSTETARRAYGLYLSNDAQIRAVHDRYYKSMGVDGFDKVVKNDYQYNKEALGTALETLKSALADASGVAPVLGAIADSINRLAKAASEHPDLAKGITWGGGAVAAGVGGYGAYQVVRGMLGMMRGFGLPAAATQLSTAAVALEAAAAKLTGAAVAEEVAAKTMGTTSMFNVPRFGGPLGAGAAGIAANLLMLPDPQPQVGPDGKRVSAISAISQARTETEKSFDDLAKSAKQKVAGIGDAIGDEIKSWPPRIKDAIIAMGNGIVAEIGAELKGLFSSLNPFSKTSFGGSGAIGGGIIKASYAPGDDAVRAANDNIAAGPSIGRGNTMYDAITRSEVPNSKHPYSETLGYGAYGNPGDLTKMSIADVYRASEAIRHNRRNHTNAGPMGAFQILGSTMLAASKALGYDIHTTRFDAAHQQAMAAWIATHQGLGAWEGLKRNPHEMAVARRAGVGLHPSTSAPAPRPQATQPQHHHHLKIELDGKQIEARVTSHQTDRGRFPTAVGGVDSYGSYASPGTPLFDAA